MRRAKQVARSQAALERNARESNSVLMVCSLRRSGGVARVRRAWIRLRATRVPDRLLRNGSRTARVRAAHARGPAACRGPMSGRADPARGWSARRAIPMAMIAVVTVMACNDESRTAGTLLCGACWIVSRAGVEVAEDEAAALASCGECAPGTSCNRLYRPPIPERRLRYRSPWSPGPVRRVVTIVRSARGAQRRKNRRLRLAAAGLLEPKGSPSRRPTRRPRSHRQTTDRAPPRAAPLGRVRRATSDAARRCRGAHGSRWCS